MALSSLLPRGLAIILLATFSNALHITPGSSCSSVCGDSLKTLPSDVVCNDFDYYSTSAGATFMDCIQCLQTSNTTTDSEDDVSWLLYNLRYASAVCLYDFPTHNNTNANSSCDLEYACAPLQGALEYGALNPSNETEYGYCQADNNAFYGTGIDDCVSCLQSSASTYTANFLLALEAGCQQEPAAGTLLTISGSIFSTTAINTTNPSDTTTTRASSASSSSTRVLSLTAVIGIAVGLGVLFLLAAGLFALYCLQQRRHAHEDAGMLHNNPYPSHQDRFYHGTDSSATVGPATQTYVLPQYTVDYKSQPAAPNIFRESPVPGPQPSSRQDDDVDFTNNAEYYDRLEGRSRGRPLQAHPVRLTNNHDTFGCVSNSGTAPSDTVDSIGNLPASALPTHPAYIPRTAAPGHLGGRASRTASRSASTRSSAQSHVMMSRASSTEPLQARSQSRQSQRGAGGAKANTAGSKPPSYAMEVYLDARDEAATPPPAERAPSRAQERNIQVELADPLASSYETENQTRTQRPPQLGLSVPPPVVSWRSRRASVSPERQAQPPPPDRAASATPNMSSLLLPSVPRIRVPVKKPPKLRIADPVEDDHHRHQDGGAGVVGNNNNSGGHVGISGPLAFPGGRFSVKPPHNDRIVEQTVDRVGAPQAFEIPIGSGKSYLYG